MKKFALFDFIQRCNRVRLYSIPTTTARRLSTYNVVESAATTTTGPINLISSKVNKFFQLVSPNITQSFNETVLYYCSTTDRMTDLTDKPT